MQVTETLFDSSRFSLADITGDGKLFDEYWKVMKERYHRRAVLKHPEFLVATDLDAARRDMYVAQLPDLTQRKFEVLVSDNLLQKYKRDRGFREYRYYHQMHEDIYTIYDDLPTVEELREMPDAGLRRVQHERGVLAFGAKFALARYISTVQDRRAMTNAGDIHPIYWTEFGYFGDVAISLWDNYLISSCKDKYDKLAYTLNKKPYYVHMETPPKSKEEEQRKQVRRVVG